MSQKTYAVPVTTSSAAQSVLVRPPIEREIDSESIRGVCTSYGL